MLRSLFPLQLRWLLLAFVLLGLLYGYAVPIFESPDETTHFGMIQYITSTGELPVQRVGQNTIYAQEGSQPPLYYLLGSLIARLFDRSDFKHVLEHNPHAIVGEPGALGNKNIVLHDQIYPPPLQGTALAVYALRLFSLMLGAVTVTAVYHSAGLIMSEKRWLPLLAAGLTAFNPQFIFISASVNNDNLVTAMNSLVIWQILLLLRDGFQRRRSLFLAILIALATISKLSGLVLIPVLGLAALWRVYRDQNWRGLVTLGVLVAVGWSLLAGWWYMRNLRLYGEFTGTQTMLDIFGRRPAPTLAHLVTDEFEGLRISYWGLFGWFNVFTVQPFYKIMDLLSLLGVLGLLRYLWLNRPRLDSLIKVGILMLCVLLGVLSLITWTSQTAASQGRLLFPYIVAISTLLALGLSSLEIPPLAIVVPLGAFALAVPLVTIMPEYGPPAPIESLPALAVPLDVYYGDIELLGYATPRQRYAPGDSVPVTLYWRPRQRSDLDYSLFIQILNSDDQVVANLPTYPGWGSLQTTSWQPGQIYPDSYTVRIPESVMGQWPVRIHVGWWKFPEGFELDPIDNRGQPLGNVILDAGAFATRDDSAETLAVQIEPIEFGASIRLLAYTLVGDSLRLEWQAVNPVRADDTVLVHVLAEPYQAGGAYSIIGQGDAPPKLPTSYWRAGERFVTEHQLRFATTPNTGQYPLYIGWYNPASGQRLAADCLENVCLLTTIAIR